MTAETFRASIVQRPPVLLDRAASTARVLEGLEEAAAGGARLVVFPETYLPGYPEYIWRLSPAGDYELSSEIHGRLLAEAIDIEAGQLVPIQDAARLSGLTVFLGIHERDADFSRATVFNTLVVIGADGEIINRHRKLVPTGPERMVWSRGDGAGLT